MIRDGAFVRKFPIEAVLTAKRRCIPFREIRQVLFSKVNNPDVHLLGKP
jgi:hypothetical protein